MDAAEAVTTVTGIKAATEAVSKVARKDRGCHGSDGALTGKRSSGFGGLASLTRRTRSTCRSPEVGRVDTGEPRADVRDHPGGFSDGSDGQRMVVWVRWESNAVPASMMRLSGTTLISERVNGEGGIRTHGDPKATPVFKTGAFNRSATSPGGNADGGVRTS